MNKELSLTINSISGILKEIRSESIEIQKQSNVLEDISNQVTKTTKEVSNAINCVAMGSTSQAEELINMNTKLFSFGKSLDNICESISDIDSNINTIGNETTIGHKELENITESIKKISVILLNVINKTETLNKSVSNVSEIIGLIDSIADQTNLLSLNASIESARAGEAGK